MGILLFSLAASFQFQCIARGGGGCAEGCGRSLGKSCAGALSRSLNAREKRRKLRDLGAGFAKQWKVRDIPVYFMLDRQEQGQPTLLIDVRDESRRAVSMIEGAIVANPSGIPIALMEFRRTYAKALPDRAAIIVYSTLGEKSARVVARWKKILGTESGVPLFTLRGGIIAYASAGGYMIQPHTLRWTAKVHPGSAKWAEFVMSPARAAWNP